MKTMKLMLASIAVLLAIPFESSADVWKLALVPNPHGEAFPMYRRDSLIEPGIDRRDQAVGTNIVIARPREDLALTLGFDGHGRPLLQHWRVR